MNDFSFPLCRAIRVPFCVRFCVARAHARTGQYPDPARIKHHPTSFWIKLSALLNVAAGAAYIWWRAARSMPDDPVRCVCMCVGVLHDLIDALTGVLR